MMRLVQLCHPERGRHVAIVDENELRLLQSYISIHCLSVAALEACASLEAFAATDASSAVVDYGAVYRGDSDWRILPAFDHPHEPARCLVTGTGLTHKASALSRQAMHSASTEGTPPVTDSLRMFQWGLDEGRPAPGEIGVQPEWFYKGNGTILRAHNQPLEVPAFAEDGGEEPEIAGVYLVDADGQPRRVGLAIGNEFSDHVMEKRNYLYLAPSKLRTCALGPELIVNAEFCGVQGTVSIERGGEVVWSHKVSTGEENMSHTVANLEHHHFKYAAHRRPGDAHVHFFGAEAFSFSSGIKLDDGDVMVIEFPGYGRALRNPIHIDPSPQSPVSVTGI